MRIAATQKQQRHHSPPNHRDFPAITSRYSIDKSFNPSTPFSAKQQRLLHRDCADRHQRARQQTEQAAQPGYCADQQRGFLTEDDRGMALGRVEIHQLDDTQVIERAYQREQHRGDSKPQMPCLHHGIQHRKFGVETTVGGTPAIENISSSIMKASQGLRWQGP